MNNDEKKIGRLRDNLPVIDIAEGVGERMEGREWLRVSVLAIKEKVSTSTILNRIRSGKLEGCVMCGVIHTRIKNIHGRIPQSQGGQENEQSQIPTEAETDED